MSSPIPDHTTALCAIPDLGPVLAALVDEFRWPHLCASPPCLTSVPHLCASLTSQVVSPGCLILDFLISNILSRVRNTILLIWHVKEILSGHFLAAYGGSLATQNTYPKLSQIAKSKFELGRVKQINPASDHGITD